METCILNTCVVFSKMATNLKSGGNNGGNMPDMLRSVDIFQAVSYSVCPQHSSINTSQDAQHKC